MGTTRNLHGRQVFTVRTLDNSPARNRQGLLALALATGEDQKAGNWLAYWKDGREAAGRPRTLVLRYYWTDLIEVDPYTGTALDISPNGLDSYSMSTKTGLAVATGVTAEERRQATAELWATIKAGGTHEAAR